MVVTGIVQWVCHMEGPIMYQVRNAADYASICSYVTYVAAEADSAVFKFKWQLNEVCIC